MGYNEESESHGCNVNNMYCGQIKGKVFQTHTAVVRLYIHFMRIVSYELYYIIHHNAAV